MKKLFDIVPWWVDALLICLLVGALWAAKTGYDHHQQGIGASRVQAQWNAERLAQKNVVIQAQATTNATNQAQDAKAQKVDTDVKAKNQTVDSSVSRLVAERDGLRDTLARVRADAMSEGTTRTRLAAELAAATDSFSECSGRYSALAESHDRLSIQVTGLLELAPPD